MKEVWDLRIGSGSRDQLPKVAGFTEEEGRLRQLNPCVQGFTTSKWTHGMMAQLGWPALPVSQGLRDFPGHGIFSGNTKKVPGKPGCAGYLRTRSSHFLMH